MKKTVALILMLTLLLTAIPICATADTSAYSSTSTAGWSSGRLGNMQRAVNALNQTYVSAGETFSFNSIVGPRTKSAGYVSAMNDRGTKVVGGGVSQVATTLYLALLQLDAGTVSFVELDTYGSRFSAGYLSDGDYAVVTDYKNGTDFCFTNRSSESLYIEMWFSGNSLCCSISKKTSGGSWFDSTTPQNSSLLGSSTIYVGSERNLLHNVSLAADTLNGTIVYGGGVFSFNDAVGPRTEAYGYEKAINGRGSRVRGGGVAQVASAVWLAIKNSGDFTIIDKTTYGSRYNQSYVSSSADAIVTDYSAGTDFVWRYNGSGSITIYTWTDSNYLYCEIYRS